MAARADKPRQPGRVSYDQGMRRDIPGHDCASANHGKAAHCHPWQDDGSCTNRSSILHKDSAHLPIRLALELAIWSNRPGPLVIGQAGMGPDEDTVLNRCAV